MKALVKKYAEPGIWMEDVPMPEVGVNDVLIKIWKVAICGTDLHIYNWDQWSQNTIKVPMTIGHEYVGEIVKVGSGVQNYKIGDRVTGEGHIACGHCRNCRRGREHICENSIGVGVNRNGAFAEYLSLPASNVVKVDSRIPDDFVAIMDPFGNATHTALSFPLLGEDVLITGAGLIGTMATAIAKGIPLVSRIPPGNREEDGSDTLHQSYQGPVSGDCHERARSQGLRRGPGNVRFTCSTARDD